VSARGSLQQLYSRIQLDMTQWHNFEPEQRTVLFATLDRRIITPSSGPDCVICLHCRIALSSHRDVVSQHLHQVHNTPSAALLNVNSYCTYDHSALPTRRRTPTSPTTSRFTRTFGSILTAVPADPVASARSTVTRDCAICSSQPLALLLGKLNIGQRSDRDGQIEL
jgi:hypothetical protein